MFRLIVVFLFVQGRGRLLYSLLWNESRDGGWLLYCLLLSQCGFEMQTLNSYFGFKCLCQTTLFPDWLSCPQNLSRPVNWHNSMLYYVIYGGGASQAQLLIYVHTNNLEAVNTKKLINKYNNFFSVTSFIHLFYICIVWAVWFHHSKLIVVRIFV